MFIKWIFLMTVLLSFLLGCGPASHDGTSIEKENEYLIRYYQSDDSFDERSHRWWVNYRESDARGKASLDIGVLSMDVKHDSLTDWSHWSSISKQEEGVVGPGVIREGFTLSVDKDGAVSLVAKNPAAWQAFEDEVGKDVAATLIKGFAIPGFIRDIPQRLGATVELKAFYRAQTAILEVTAVRPKTLDVEIRLSTNKHNEDMFATASINRQNGRIERLSMVSLEPMPRPDEDDMARGLLVMVPADKAGSFGMLESRHLSAGESLWDETIQWYPITSIGAPGWTQQPTGKALEFDVGDFEWTSESELTLYLPLADNERAATGSTKFRDLVAKSKAGAVVPLSLHSGDGFWHQPTESGYQAKKSALAKGWDVEAQREQVVTISGKVDFSPFIQQFSIPWPKERSQTFELDEAVVSVRYHPEEALYSIGLESAEVATLLPWFSGLEGEFGQIPSDIGPDWLGAMEARWLDLAPTRYQLKISNAPDTVNLWLAMKNRTPLETREVTWVLRNDE